MPINVTPVGAAPQAPAGPAKYVPHRSSPSMAPSQAPIDERALPPGTAPGGAKPPPRAPVPGAAAADGEPIEGQEGDAGEGDEQEKGPDAWRFAKLAEKDRIARKRVEVAQAAEARLKALEDRINAREAAVKADEDRRAIWRRDPAALLRDHGYNAEAALQYMLNGEKLTPQQEFAASLDDKLTKEREAREAEMQRIRDEQTEREKARDDEQRKQQEDQHAQAEQLAVQELHADIGDVITGDAKGYSLLQKSGERGVAAVYQRLNELSDKQLKETGRRPPLTTKMLERAAAEVEADARKELQETLSDEEIADALGIAVRPRPPAPRGARPSTLTSGMAARGQLREPTEAETAAQKKARVVQQIEGIWQKTRRP